MKFTGSHLKKTFQKKHVVKNVSFEVQVGEVVGLLGPNGAGKTTCFLLMAGVIRPDDGKIFLGSQEITHWPLHHKARLGLRYLPQDASIFTGMTVEKNLLAAAELVEPNVKQQKALVQQLLEEFGLEHLRHSSALVLSGGERRRVEIARALVGDPHFLLLDEPFAGIDPKSLEDLRTLVFQLKERKVGVIISDHNVRETLGVVDRAYILHCGEILAEGIPDVLTDNPLVRDVYLGENFSL